MPKIVGRNGGLRIGERCSFNHDVFLNCAGSVTLGSNVTLSKGTSIISAGLDVEKLLLSDLKTHIVAPVVIGNNVWIAANVTILPGVSIANNTVIAAGAVVNRNVTEEYSVYAGIPARKVKQY